MAFAELLGVLTVLVSAGGGRPTFVSKVAMIPPRGERALQALFYPPDHEAARSIIDGYCITESLDVPPERVERVAAPALKLSDGALAGLGPVVELARHDGRDLLMASGFGHNLAAHDAWLDDLQTSPTRGAASAGTARNAADT